MSFNLSSRTRSIVFAGFVPRSSSSPCSRLLASARVGGSQAGADQEEAGGPEAFELVNGHHRQDCLQ